MYKSPVSGKSAESSGMPTNPVLPKMKQNMNTRSRSGRMRIAFAIRNVTAVIDA